MLCSHHSQAQALRKRGRLYVCLRGGGPEWGDLVSKTKTRRTIVRHSARVGRLELSPTFQVPPERVCKLGLCSCHGLGAIDLCVQLDLYC